MANNTGNNLEILMNKIEDFVSSKTVVGEAVKIGEVTLVPLVDVSVGVGAGGAENGAGGGALGAKITPSAVLAISNGSVQLVNIKNQDTITKILDMIPDVVDRFTSGKEEKMTEEDVMDILDSDGDEQD